MFITRLVKRKGRKISEEFPGSPSEPAQEEPEEKPKEPRNSFKNLEIPTFKNEKVSKNETVGPSRSSSNLRVTSRFDYQADICKDYKETGYCGFGDSCKFLHDRSDYQPGWKIDKEWEKEQAKKTRHDRSRHQDDDEDDDQKKPTESEVIPSSCCACKKSWQECLRPKCKTLCSHFYCEDCFALFCKKTCKVCRKATNGVFIPVA